VVGYLDPSLPASTAQYTVVRAALDQGISTLADMFPGELNRNAWT